jgi:pSer/pThr/pTyr-binding forkhead associated (FHA) protein
VDLVASDFPLTIGRHADCEYQLDFAFISRRHCGISRRGGELWVRDLESANGTTLNGKLLQNPQQLCEGDQLALGPLTFRVSIRHTNPETREYDVTTDSHEYSLR